MPKMPKDFMQTSNIEYVSAGFHINLLSFSSSLERLESEALTKSMKMYVAFTRKSTYAQKSTTLELALPFSREVVNEHLPRMSAPFFSQNGCSHEK